MTPLELANFRFTWYSGRHTKATDLLENGASTGTWRACWDTATRPWR